jgi:uncharacterized protein (DUF2164 family)
MAHFILKAEAAQHKRFVRLRKYLMDQCDIEFKRFEREHMIVDFMLSSRLVSFFTHRMIEEWFTKEFEFEGGSSDDDNSDNDATAGVEDVTDAECETDKEVTIAPILSKRKRRKKWRGFNKNKVELKEAASRALKKLYGTDKKCHRATLVDELSETKQLTSQLLDLCSLNARASIALREVTMELDALEQRY